jgi:excisionase family DNA binding protein
VKKLDEYLKITDAAKFLGVSVNTLRKWADEGRIPVHINPANGYRLFRQADLEAYLNAVAKRSQRPS